MRTYKSFNKDKTIEALEYDMLQYSERLLHIKAEQDFYSTLVNAPIFKPRTANLFEKLEQFKRQIQQTKTLSSGLLNEISTHINKINNKTEWKDLGYRNSLVTGHDVLEHKIHDFFVKTADSKSQLLQYIQSVLLD